MRGPRSAGEAANAGVLGSERIDQGRSPLPTPVSGDSELVRRLEFCHTPKHGSWLNIAENELSALTRQCLRGRRIGDLETLHSEVSAWSGDVNGTQRGVDWQMKVNDARCKLKSVYPKIVT